TVSSALLSHNKRRQHTDEDKSQGDGLYTSNNQESGDSDMLLVRSDSYTDSYILDSNCSFYMTPHKEWFETYKVGSLDDKTCGIVGIGQIKVHMHDGIIRTLTELTRGYDGDEGPAYNRESLSLDIKHYCGATTTVSAPDYTTLWHLHLGHIGEHGLTELYKRGLLAGLKSYKMRFCKFCIMGKQYKVYFKTGQHTRMSLLDFVHSVVWGPIREESLGGARYFVTSLITIPKNFGPTS
ncbi:LOW QUALITY PROTEIN: hypothetical protein V2J09_009391, partial [Rumex salicifolius]